MGPAEYLAGRTSPTARLELVSSGMAADCAKVYLVHDAETSVLEASPDEFPYVIRETTEKARLASEVLGEDLAQHIPVPLDEWEADGVSCALFELLLPISNGRLKRFIQLRKIIPPVLKWLRNVAEVDRGINKEAQSCLRALFECPVERLRGPAQTALARIEAGALVPRSTVMHGDLWIGNVLIDSVGERDFVVIDWRGSNVDGFPIFDLIKFAESARLGRGYLRAELAAHAEILACDVQDTRTYLLAALGYIWSHLGLFPPDRFAMMAETNLSTLDAALNG